MNTPIRITLGFILILIGLGVLIMQPFVKTDYKFENDIVYDKQETLNQTVKEQEQKQVEAVSQVSEVVTKRFEQEEKKTFPDIADSVRTRILNHEINQEEDCDIYTYQKDFCKMFLTEKIAIANNNPELCSKYYDTDFSKLNCVSQIRLQTKDDSICTKYIENLKLQNKCLGKPTLEEQQVIDQQE